MRLTDGDDGVFAGEEGRVRVVKEDGELGGGSAGPCESVGGLSNPCASATAFHVLNLFAAPRSTSHDAALQKMRRLLTPVRRAGLGHGQVGSLCGSRAEKRKGNERGDSRAEHRSDY